MPFLAVFLSNGFEVPTHSVVSAPTEVLFLESIDQQRTLAMPSRSRSDAALSSLPLARGLDLDVMTAMLRRFREAGEASPRSSPGSNCDAMVVRDGHVGSADDLQSEECESASGIPSLHTGLTKPSFRGAS